MSLVALLVATPAAAAAPLADRASEAVSQERAFDHVRALTQQIGSRPGHTQAYFAAVAYAHDQLEPLGYRVVVEDFIFPHWEDRGSSVEADGFSVPAKSMRWSNGGADVRGALVDVGLARDTDLGGRRLDGQIALARRGEITFQAKAENAKAKGAAGLVVYNHEAGELNGQLQSRLDFPVVGVSAADGERLLSAAGRGVGLHSAGVVAERLSTNVIAHGGDDPGRVLVGAHLDSVPAGPGANDNASGSAAVLELARVFAERPEKARLSFALFGAEEDGLWGSRRHVEALRGGATQPYRAMVNLDMVSVGERVEVGTTGDRSRDLAERIVQVGSALGIQVGRFDASGSSDHAPFAAAGVPAVMLHWREDPNYHKPTDTADRIDPEKLAGTTRVVAGVIEELLAAG